MQCKDVKQWMNDNKGEFNVDIAEHLSRCPSCARAVEANRRLNDLFKASMGSEPVPSFAVVRRRTEALAAESTIQEKIMAFIKNQFQTRPGLLAGATLAILAFLFVTLVPFSYTHTAAYTISVTDTGDENDSTLQKVERAIVEADVDNATVVVVSENNPKRYTITPIASREAADEIARVLEKYTGERVKLSVDPVVRIKVDPIYAQVISKVKTDGNTRPRVKIQLPDILFDGDLLVEVITDLDLNDAEVESRLSEKFMGHGLSADEFEINSETDTDKGTRVVKFGLPSENTESGRLEMEMSFGFSVSSSEYKNLALSLKTGKLVKVHMADEEADDNVIIMKVSTEDSTE